jgi:starch-binding outer membrane protein, SusD/RagB family
MKNKLLYIFLFICLLSAGCQKYLNVDPKNQRALESVEDVKASLAGYLEILKPGEQLTSHPSIGDVMFMTPAYWSYFEFSSDNIDFQRDYATYINANSFSDKDEAKLLLKNDFSRPTLIWMQHYKCIGFLNVLLDALDKASGNATEKAQLRNEMLVCRSIYYFKLLEYFSPYKNADMGIPVYTGVQGPFTGLAVPRKTQKEVFDFILADLNEAENSTADPDPNYNLLYNKMYVNNELAQVYWYKAESGAAESTDYTNARKFAAASLLGVILPATKDEYINSLNGAFPDYPALQRYVGGYSGVFSELTYGQQWGNVPFAPHASPDLLALFSPDDIRYQSMIQPDSTVIRPMVQWPNDFTTAYTLFRPEEAYMIQIEATLKDQTGGSETDARILLNAFRRIRGISSDYNGSDLNQEIVNERRREFCFNSDMRWIDMKRYGIGSSLDNLQIFGKTYNVDMQPNGYQYALPIPVDQELKLNPALTPNPDWNEIIF